MLIKIKVNIKKTKSVYMTKADLLAVFLLS